MYSGITFTFRITDQATGCEVTATASGNALGKFLNSKHTATATLDINRTAVGANACDANDVNYKLKMRQGVLHLLLLITNTLLMEVIHILPSQQQLLR